VNNFDHLANLFPWGRYSAGNLIEHRDLQAMHKALHPDSNIDPWREIEHMHEVDVGVGVGAITALPGCLAGVWGGLATGVVGGAAGAGIYLAIERLIYGSPNTYYSQQRQKLLDSTQY
jgi:hypothetical protein